MGVPEKHTDDITPAPRSSGSIDAGKLEVADDAFEVFKKGDGAVDFRTVGWIQASVIFLKSELPYLLQQHTLQATTMVDVQSMHRVSPKNGTYM